MMSMSAQDDWDNASLAGLSTLPYRSCQLCARRPRRIDSRGLKVEPHGAVRLHHRRRGFLTRQGSRVGGTRRAAASARLQRAAAQARSVSQRRSRHDVALSARRGVRHRRRRRDRPRPRPLRALHRQSGQHARTTSPPAASTRTSSPRSGAATISAPPSRSSRTSPTPSRTSSARATTASTSC